jgi:gas vesicle protein
LGWNDGCKRALNSGYAALPIGIKSSESIFLRSVTMASSKWSGFVAFFIGASLGVVAGMLLAPKSGEELREDLTDRLNDGAHRIRTASKTVSRRAQEMADEVQQGVSDMADAGLRAARKVTRS